VCIHFGGPSKGWGLGRTRPRDRTIIIIECSAWFVFIRKKLRLTTQLFLVTLKVQILLRVLQIYYGWRQ
jgi:hypothetical protein